MSVLGRLASALGRNDERPNVELGEALAASGDAAAIAELVEALAAAAPVASDAIKVLYEAGERRPALLAPHLPALLAALGSRNNRLVWGAMHAVSAMTAERPDEVLAALPTVLAAADRGSVIAKDHAMRILVVLAGAGHAEQVLPIALGRLAEAAPNQFPTYAEALERVASGPHRERFRQILEARRETIEGAAKRARVEKLLRNLAR